MNVTVTIYQVKENARLTWTTLGLGEHAVTETGAHPARLQKSIADALRGVIMKLKPRELEAFEMVRGTRLETVHLELSLRHEGKKRKLSLVCPIVIEPRWASGSERFTVAYHPARQGEWFPYHEDGGTLAEQATAYFTQAWATLNDEDIEKLRLRGKALLKSFAFSVTRSPASSTMYVSLPAPPDILSAPAPPSRMLSPLLPVSVFAIALPVALMLFDKLPPGSPAGSTSVRLSTLAESA